MKLLFIPSIMNKDWSHLNGLLAVLAVLYSCVFVSVLIDLFFGVKRAKQLKVVRTSFGYRRTITKLTSYFGLMIMLTIEGVQKVFGHLFLSLKIWPFTTLFISLSN